MVHTLLANGRP